MISQSSPWHSLTHAEVVEQLGSSLTGLSKNLASHRLTEYGPNELQAGQKVSAWQIFLDQFKNVLLLILIVAILLSVATGRGTESIIIAVIVMFAVALGFIQEYRAERAMELYKEWPHPWQRSYVTGKNFNYRLASWYPVM